MIRKGAHMYSDRQTELSVFLEQLRQLAEEKTEERVIIHAVTKEDGEKIMCSTCRNCRSFPEIE